MDKSSPSSDRKKPLALLGSMFFPKTPRGKVRRAVFLILVLFVFAGTMSQPKHWNAAADWLNGKGISAPHYWDIPFRLGLDLQGGTHLVYVADVSEMEEDERGESISGVRDVIERRVNAFGVSEPLVQTNKSGDEWRVIVDLAGIKDISEAIRLIGETPILEFKEQGTLEPQRALTEEERADMDAFNAEAESKVDEALARALDGEDFAALVSEYSDHDPTKDNGGDLGYLTVNDMFFRPVLDAIEEGGYAEGTVLPEPVQTQYGYHVVKYEGSREAGKEFEAAHILVCFEGKMRCEQERSREEAQALIDSIKAEATGDDFGDLAAEHSDDVVSAADKGSLGWFSEGQMVKEFEDTVMAMEIGAISDVVETDFGFHLISKTGERPMNERKVSHILVSTRDDSYYLPPPDPWSNTLLSGKHLKRATLQFHGQTNEPQVGLDFNDEGKELFAEITRRNVGKPVAIFLDGEPISIPTVQEEIHDGSAVITGSFTIQEAKLLARRLNAGALPVPIHLETQQSVGASLGQDSLTKSLYAGLLGFLIVAIFMLMYYRLPGLIAIAALTLYTSVNLALYKLIPVTLTLSGIAGFILSVGMAVDANILIFERLKEELLRGRTLGSAIDEGFRRAWLSIRDSNFTTLISCTILFYTSSSLIKGFALTLGIGVLVSMFSAITVSRTLLRFVSGWQPMRNAMLYLPGAHRLPKEHEEETN